MSKNDIQAFERTAPTHVNALSIIADFLISKPEFARKPVNGTIFNTEEYWEKIATKFANGRIPRPPSKPKTISDSLIPIILEEYFGLPKVRTVEIGHEHGLSMAAENIVGNLLERYIASQMEPAGWVWCSGEIVNKVDFLFPLGSSQGDEPKWVPLQVKNRDNSENSSSSSVRDGTDIIKWFRSFAKTGATNWHAFPKSQESREITEAAFEAFARNYLRQF